MLAGAGAQRLQWDDLPGHVQRGIENRLGAPVVEATNQVSGFSPGFASRLVLSNGRRVFAKAVSAAQNRESPGIYRQEARYAVALPATTPAPRLMSTFDDDEWVALMFEDIDGQAPEIPWRSDELDRVLDVVALLSELLTPAPFEAPPLAQALDRQFHGWRRLAGPNRSDDASRLDAWAQANLDRLAELESSWAEGVAGGTLLHSDLRADNILLTPTRVYVVDWPWARVGAAWFDLLCMLPSVAMQDGGDPELIFRRHPVSRDADPFAVTAALAGLAGYFLRSGLQPAPPGLPTLRDFQLAQGEAALAWLRQRVNW